MKSTKSLFEIRKETHVVFDPLWQSGAVTRNGAYKILAKITGRPLRDAHIGKLSAEECMNVKQKIRKGDFSIADGKKPRKGRYIWIKKNPSNLVKYCRNNIKTICRNNNIFIRN